MSSDVPMDAATVLDQMTDAFFALDEDRRFTYLNEGGREVICEAMGADRTATELHGRRIWDAVPDARETTFYDHYERAFETGDPVRFEASYEPLDTVFDVRAHPTEWGLAVYFQDVTERREAVAELERTVEVMNDLYVLVSDPYTTFEERCDRIIELGRSHLEMPYGFLTLIDDDTQRIVRARGDHDLLQAGEECPLDRSYCRHTLEADGLVSMFDAIEAGMGTDPAYETFELGSYIGAKVFVDKDVYGTFCFAASEPRGTAFTDSEETFVELASRLISYELEHRKYRTELERRAERYRRLAENFPNGAVYIFDEDLRFRLARGEGVAALGGPEAVEGHTLAEVFDEDHVEALEPHYSAALDGESVAFEHRHDGRDYTVRAVPVPGDDGAVTEAMAVTQDVTERVERERKLERYRAHVQYQRKQRELSELEVELAVLEAEHDEAALADHDEYAGLRERAAALEASIEDIEAEYGGVPGEDLFDD